MRTDRHKTPGAAQHRADGGDSWSGRIVLLAGATGGIGHAITTKLIAHGAKVLVLPRSPEQSTQTGEGPRAGALHHLSLDPCRPADVTYVLGQILDHGEVDVLIYVAAPLEQGECHIPGGPNILERMFHVNVVVPADLSTVLLPGMIERRRGHIVNVASEMTIGHNVACSEAYIASKEALEAYTRKLACRLSSTSVMANMLHLADGSLDMLTRTRPNVSERGAGDACLGRTTAPVGPDGSIAESQAVERFLGRLLNGPTSWTWG